MAETVRIPAATQAISYPDLYARWERGNWRASEIDFSADVEDWRERMTPEQRRAALWLFSLFVHGEDAVAMRLSAYIDAAPDPYQRYFLTTQQVDESRHAVFFERFLHEVVGIGDGSPGSVLGATSDALTWGHKQLFARLDRMSEELRQDPSPENLAAGIMLYHMLIEGASAQPGQHLLEQALEKLDLLPGFVEGMRLVAADEQRHIAFGVRLLADLQATHGKPVIDAAIALLREVMPFTAGLAAPPGWDWSYTDSLGFSVEDLYEESGRLFEARLRAAGLPLDDIERFPFPLELSPRERATRGLRLLEAQLIGPKTRPFTLDEGALGVLFDSMRRQADPRAMKPGTVVQWDFTDAPAWRLEFDGGAVRAAPGRAERRDLTIRSGLEDWIDVMQERANLGRLLLVRRVRLRGNPTVLARLPKAFA